MHEKDVASTWKVLYVFLGNLLVFIVIQVLSWLCTKKRNGDYWVRKVWRTTD
jgi:hypothetical protein